MIKVISFFHHTDGKRYLKNEIIKDFSEKEEDYRINKKQAVLIGERPKKKTKKK